jgi:type I restriction enzyme M protein
VDQGEHGRWRAFSREWIAARGDNLDIAWLKDELEDGAETLPEPAVLVRGAMGELQAALDELRDILQELGEEADEVEA